MKPKLGSPTEYHFHLPIIRRNLCRNFYKKNKIKDHLILDYGCGNGANTFYYASDFDLVIGVDVEKERLQKAREIAIKFNKHNIQYLLYGGNHLPLNDSSIDVVIAFEVIEHVKNDYKSLKEIRRVLKKGGLFCISVPNKWYLMETHGFNLPFKEFIPYNRIPFLNLLPYGFYERYGNARIYNKKHIISLLEHANFTVLHSSYIKPPFDKVKNKILKTFSQKIYSFLPNFMGVSIFIVCRK